MTERPGWAVVELGVSDEHDRISERRIARVIDWTRDQDDGFPGAWLVLVSRPGVYTPDRWHTSDKGLRVMAWTDTFDDARGIVDAARNVDRVCFMDADYREHGSLYPGRSA